ncbi:hypothetical protein DRP05_13585 [Archaeoglobales archaeon]|nr:MAG: hypothetical protein DRP05_13585 [Archaeoglobales archaeon]
MLSWQEFEEITKTILESHGFETKFRFVFRDEKSKSEIDVLAVRHDIMLAIDAKRYTAKWHRKSALKKQAEKHVERCERYSKLINKRVIPVIVSLIDDQIVFHEGCIVVPFESLNDFLIDLHAYLDEFGFL